VVDKSPTLWHKIRLTKEFSLAFSAQLVEGLNGSFTSWLYSIQLSLKDENENKADFKAKCA